MGIFGNKYKKVTAKPQARESVLEEEEKQEEEPNEDNNDSADLYYLEREIIDLKKRVLRIERALKYG